MEVYYNGKKIKENEFLKISETQVEPKIKLNVNSNQLYTLIMYDPDAVKGTYIHWTKANITNNDIKSGNIIIPYKGPAPPAKSGKHRYVFKLFKQYRESEIKEISERLMEINDLKKILNLDNLYLYKIKFISENESGGKRKNTRKNTRNTRKNTRNTRKNTRNTRKHLRFL
jgi:phosphatidylethanolamine-binding protein (PEBP) family uncharacterized protein